MEVVCIFFCFVVVVVQAMPGASISSEKAIVTRTVLVTGSTGYLGRALIPELLARGHRVKALVRPGAEKKLPPGAESVTGNALVAEDVHLNLPGVDTVIHLVGVSKPSPAKAREFREVDLLSIQATVDAIKQSEPCPHLIYLSVAQPAPVMKAYVAMRAAGEALIRAAGGDATCLRPWYVLGPGHRWPYLLVPIFAVLRILPATRATAERLGFVTLRQMVRSLVRAVENRPAGMRIVDVPEIRRA